MSKFGRRDKSPSSPPPVREEAPSVVDEGEEKFVQKTVIAPVTVVEDVEEHPNSPAAAGELGCSSTSSTTVTGAITVF